MARKFYEIKVADALCMKRLLKEIDAWQLSASEYTVFDNTLTTSDKNVVDVATETFINCPTLLQISEGAA